MQYNGIFTDGATRIRSAPLFETGDERYAWLNSVQAIGLGSVGDGDVSYDVYQVLCELRWADLPRADRRRRRCRCRGSGGRWR